MAEGSKATQQMRRSADTLTSGAQEKSINFTVRFLNKTAKQKHKNSESICQGKYDVS